MTDRFKQVADSLNKYKPHLSGMGGSIRIAELGVFARNHIDILTEALYLAQEVEELRKERDELASALNEYYIMYGDRSIISRVDDLLEKAGILND